MSALVEKHNRPVPRYTSYPTAVQFHTNVSASYYTDILGALPANQPLSLYLHIPFCKSLCHYCGCFTKVIHHEEPIRRYASLLREEIALVAKALGKRHKLCHLHFGGGTPNYLPDDEFQSLMSLLRRCFSFEDGAELAIEMDPRFLTKEKVALYAESGINRASLGVQSFDPKVQEAIGRIQPYEKVSECVNWLRSAGIKKINFDLIYGLPLQSVESFRETVKKAISLHPDRLALFGYAHVPWARKHQKKLEQYSLPPPKVRLDQFAVAKETLEASGYVMIGIDHFARKDDALYQAWREGRLLRNFQGYTTDTATHLIGVGMTAISSLPQAYVQNTSSIKSYRESIEKSVLPVARGCVLNADDLLRRDIIERIMCDFTVDLKRICALHEVDLNALSTSIERLKYYQDDGLADYKGGVVKVTEKGRHFVRLIAACFDVHLESGEGRHARAV